MPRNVATSTENPRGAAQNTQWTRVQQPLSNTYILRACSLESSVEQQTPNCLQLAKVQHQRPGYELKIGQRGIRTPNARCCTTQWWEEQWVSLFTLLVWPPTVLYIAYKYSLAGQVIHCDNYIHCYIYHSNKNQSYATIRRAKLYFCNGDTKEGIAINLLFLGKATKFDEIKKHMSLIIYI